MALTKLHKTSCSFLHIRLTDLLQGCSYEGVRAHQTRMARFAEINFTTPRDKFSAHLAGLIYFHLF